MSMKSIIRDFPNGSVIKNSLANAGDTVRSLGREDPLEKEMATHSSIAAAAAKSLQSCPTLCDPTDGSPPGSPSLGFSRQEHEWVAVSFSNAWKWSHSVGSSSSRPMDCSLPGSSIRGIFQARVLEWVAMPSSRGPSQLRDRTQVSHIAGGFFTIWATRGHYIGHYRLE